MENDPWEDFSGQQKDGRVQALSPVPNNETAPVVDAVSKTLVGYYLRRRTAKVSMPEPKSKAAAGRRIAGPPLVGRPPLVSLSGPVLSIPLEVLMVLWAIAAGASINSARRAAVAKITILLFIEFLLLSTYSIFYAACIPSLSRSYP